MAMKAAVVSSYGATPVCAEFREPEPKRGDVLIEVEAASITQLVRAQVAGRHYSMGAATHPPPFVAGAEGVGRTPDGRRVYFGFPAYPFGAMAGRAVVPADMIAPLPDGLDPARAAALVNPAMSSWAALTRRAHMRNGETVWVLGATGASGGLAIEIARSLGAGRIVAFGRGTARAPALIDRGADEVITLEGDDLAARVTAAAKSAPPDVVLDYIWGPPATALMSGLLKAHISNACRWVQIGAVAGDPTHVPAGLLRATPIALMGSGIGSVPTAELVVAIGEALRVADRLTIDFTTAPLDDVAAVWNSKQRTVLTMV
ncbi:MAG: zinc-binding alcohol dehydrogenase family protein [Hyphomicrobiales bacterium]|nr:zinc-binding alcohol dehydrogenase family protein [Hyphomicrobiales bacterium]